ncbi:NHL repeat-containing protein 2 [Kappamyces sp. JEL0829]|nr:NHL repeat-containing protein 2 [Kappamyces sp. JEL0829]
MSSRLGFQKLISCSYLLAKHRSKYNSIIYKLACVTAVSLVFLLLFSFIALDLLNSPYGSNYYIEFNKYLLIATWFNSAASLINYVLVMIRVNAFHKATSKTSRAFQAFTAMTILFRVANTIVINGICYPQVIRGEAASIATCQPDAILKAGTIVVAGTNICEMILYLTSSVMFLAHIVVTLDLDRSKTFQEILLHQGGFDYFVLCGMKIYMVVAVATVPKNGYNNFNQPMSCLQKLCGCFYILAKHSDKAGTKIYSVAFLTTVLLLLSNLFTIASLDVLNSPFGDNPYIASTNNSVIGNWFLSIAALLTYFIVMVRVNVFHKANSVVGKGFKVLTVVTAVVRLINTTIINCICFPQVLRSEITSINYCQPDVLVKLGSAMVAATNICETVLYISSSFAFLYHIVATLDLDRSIVWKEILLHHGGFDYLALCCLKIYAVIAVASIPTSGFTNFNQPLNTVTVVANAWAIYVYLLASYESSRHLISSKEKSNSHKESKKVVVVPTADDAERADQKDPFGVEALITYRRNWRGPVIWFSAGLLLVMTAVAMGLYLSSLLSHPVVVKSSVMVSTLASLTTVPIYHPTGLALDRATGELFVSSANSKLLVFTNETIREIFITSMPLNSGTWTLSIANDGSIYIAGSDTIANHSDFIDNNHRGLLQRLYRNDMVQGIGSVASESLCTSNQCPILSSMITLPDASNNSLLLGFKAYSQTAQLQNGMYSNLMLYDNQSNSMQAFVVPGPGAGPGSMAFPQCFAANPRDPSEIYVMSDNALFVIRNRMLTFIAGNPDGKNQMNSNAGWVDGTGAAARFNTTFNHRVDSSNSVIYLADSYNHVIRTITPSGVVNTLAGTPLVAGYQDGGQTLFHMPVDIVLGPSDRILFVSDRMNHAIRQIKLQ